MTYPGCLREKARRLRLEQRLSLDEITERLALPRTTVFDWIKDIPLQRPRNDYVTRRGRPRGLGNLIGIGSSARRRTRTG